MDHISLNSSTHNSNLVTLLDHFRALNSFVDVTLVCEGHTVKAHKIILSAGSNVLHRLLLANQAKDPIIILAETKYDTLRMIIDFLYKGKVDVPRNDLKKLLDIAISFEMNELKKLCEENLKSQNVDSELNSDFHSNSPNLSRLSPKKKRQRRQSSDSDILYDDIELKQEVCDSPSRLEEPEVSTMTHTLSAVTQTESLGFHPQIRGARSLNKTSVESSSGMELRTQKKDASTECDIQPNLARMEHKRVAARPSYNEKSDSQNSFQYVKRRFHSRIWNYFTAVSTSYAVCKLCCRKLSYRTTVTNLAKHILKMHQEYDPKNPPKLPDMPMIRISNEELEEFEEIDFSFDDAPDNQDEQFQSEEALEEGTPSTSTPCIMKIS